MRIKKHSNRAIAMVLMLSIIMSMFGQGSSLHPYQCTP